MAYITLQKLLECVKPCTVVRTWSLHTWEAVEGKVNYVPRPRGMVLVLHILQSGIDDFEVKAFVALAPTQICFPASMWWLASIHDSRWRAFRAPS